MARKPASFESVMYDSLGKAAKYVRREYVGSGGDVDKAASVIAPALIGSIGVGLTYYIIQKLKENEELRKRKFLGLF